MKIKFPVLIMIALLGSACTVEKLNEFLREGEYLNAATIEKLGSENLKEIAR